MSKDSSSSARRMREMQSQSSGLPQPASSLKRSSMAAGMNPSGHKHGRTLSGNRQTLAYRPDPPLFNATPVASGASGLSASSARRQSTFHARPMNAPSSSAPSSMGPTATPMSGGGTSGRRSSIFQPRVFQQSFFQAAPQSGGTPKDPRPLKSREFVTRMGREIMEWLALNNFEQETGYTLSANAMKSPTQKDFTHLFQWLYHRIDPHYRFQKSIDQEVPPILKWLRYPFEKSITKSQLVAVGGQNWPGLLGMLHWLMQAGQMMENASSGKYDWACKEAGFDIIGVKIVFNYLSRAYRDWLAMDDNISDEEAKTLLKPHDEQLAREFEDLYAPYIEEANRLDEEHANILAEIAEFEKRAPDIATLDKNYKIMQEDIAEFEGYNQAARQRVEKYDSRIAGLQADLEAIEQETQELSHERRNLQRLVDEQGISMEDIDRMNGERERLQKGLAASSARVEEKKQVLSEKEREAARCLGELEGVVNAYNEVAYNAGLTPPTAVNAGGKDYELRIVAKPAVLKATNISGGGTGDMTGDLTVGCQPSELINLDLRGSVNAYVSTLHKSIADKTADITYAVIKDHEALVSLKETIEEKKGELETLDHRTRTVEEEYEQTKEIMTANKMTWDTQIERLQKDLLRIRSGLTDSVRLMEQREITANVELDELFGKTNAVREELHTEIDRIINDVIKFKLHIQNGLDEFEEVVVEELTREMNEERLM